MRFNRIYINVGSGLTLTFVVLICLILAGNSLLIWQFHLAGRQTERLIGANRQVILVLRLQEQLLSLHQRLAEVVEHRDAERVASGIDPMRNTLLNQIAQTRNAVIHLPSGTRVDPAFLPTLDAISIDLPSQLDAVAALARLNAWEVVDVRLSNVMRVMESQIAVLVKSIDGEANDELTDTGVSMHDVQNRILTIVPLMAVSTFSIAAFFAWAITRKMGELRLEERIDERMRIAGELHDHLLQSIISAKMLVDLIVDQAPPNSTIPPVLARVATIMEKAINEGRNTIQGFRFHHAGDQDLGLALSRVQAELGLERQIDCEVHVKGCPRSLRPMIRNELYSIGREALVNSFRHSNAGKIEVDLEYAGQLRVKVRDDGCGIDTQILREGRAGHFGLVGMRERAERIGARLKLKSSAGAGTELELTVPGRLAFDQTDETPGRPWFKRWRTAKARDPETEHDER